MSLKGGPDRAVAIFLLFVALISGVVLFFRTARAHEPYSDWKQPDNPSISCCSAQLDCRPTKAELREDGWYVPADEPGKWIPVPWSKVLPTDLAHDGRSHVCRNGTHIYCFAPTGPKG